MAKILIGTIVSNKSDKTIVISATTRKTHRIYKKQFSTSKKFMAHDEKNDGQIGDLVSIIETRPLSARKRYTLNKILERAAISADSTVENIAKAELTRQERDAAKAAKEALDAEAADTAAVETEKETKAEVKTVKDKPKPKEAKK